MIGQFLKSYIFTKRSGALVRIIGWLSFVGVGLSVVAMVVVISVMTGFGVGMRDRILSVEPHLVVEAPEPDTRRELIEKLNSRKGIKAHLYESRDVMIRTVDGLYGGASARGIASDTLKKILADLEKKRNEGNLQLTERSFKEETYTLEKGEVVLGIDLANSLAIFPGDELVVISPEALLLPPGEVPRYERVRVKSLLRSNVPQIDSQVIFYGLGRTFRNLSYTQADLAIEVRLDDPMNFDGLKSDLEANGFSVQSWVDRNSALFYSLKIEKFLMTLFLSLTFLIGSFSIVTLIVLLSNQKRQDMGMLQAMGLATHRIRNLFAGMGVLLSASGMGVGLGLGLLICWWIDKFSILKLPDIYYDTKLPISIDYFTISIVLFLVFVLSALSSIWTSRQSTPRNPIESLRF